MGILRKSVLAIVVLLTAACSQDSAIGSQVTAADLAAMGRLVPADALAVIGTPSLAELDAALAGMLGSFGQQPPDLSAELASVPGWPGSAEVNRSLPILVAVRRAQGLAPPPLVFILPIEDADAASNGSATLSVHVDGRYVGLSDDASYVPGGVPSPLAESLPAGQLAMRADVNSLLTPLRPMAELMAPGLGAIQPGVVGGMNSAAMISAYVRVFFDAIEATQSVEAAVSFVDGHLIVEGDVDVLAGSMLADIPPASCDELDEMVGWLGDESAMQMVSALDSRAFAELTKEMMLSASEIWPSTTEDDLLEYLATLQVLSAHCGHVFVGDMEFSSDGLDCSYLFEAQDPNGLVELMTEFMREGFEFFGGRGASVETSIEDGWARSELAVDMTDLIAASATGDPEVDAAMAEMMLQMYGGDGVIRYTTRASDGRVVLSVGGNEVSAARARPSSSNGPPPELVEALERLSGADTRVVMCLDYSRIIASMAGMMAVMPGMETLRPEALELADPVPLTLWLGGRGTRWSFGFDFALDAFARMLTNVGPR
jgi:hypothetical protein